MMLQSVFRLLLPFSCLALSASASLEKRNATGATVEAVNISSPDGSAHARFINIGAAVVNFWVKDKTGNFRDIIIGFDNLTEYTTAAAATDYFGPIVGRYANRVRNGTFTIPISKDASGPGKKFQLVENDNNGTDTLHGGSDGFNSRVWNITGSSANSVSFSLLDPNGMEGFPGNVFTTVTYTLQNESTWHFKIHALADAPTPIMLSGHHYWNLEAYQESDDLGAHFVQFNSSKYVETDGNLIPTGVLGSIEGTPLDFNAAKSLGDSINQTTAGEFCGTGCVGFDNCWIYDDPGLTSTPKFSIWDTNSGIKLDIISNQPALQIYTCNSVANVPRKVDQGGPLANYTDHSCLVIEQESYIDAVNNPDFGIDPIYGPDRPYVWESTYKFSVVQK
ncbi:galactose mutarotase-like protein [Gymnopus androsaceus JB14]|uniref:Galactose mutarotase-like protein n=1 Tax=Gymnopus androsaceus JB14 TaxID=1447944 RepID=A0A6A4IPG7_9AGAR|nr:galactose mutarotase-like protein [Gymnopus androsaceus JB14]